MRSRSIGIWSLTAVVAAISMPAWAGPFQEAGQRFYQKDYQGALQLLRQAEEQNPNDPHVYAALGNTYRKLGDNADARSAYEKVLSLDPNLTSIRNKPAFAQALQTVGGGSGPSQAAPGDTSATDLINALSSGGVYVAPSLQGQVDQAALEAAVQRAQPRVVKIAAVAHTGSYANRAAMADDLRQRLNIPDDGVVLVATPKGISGASGRLRTDQIDQALKQAGVDQAFAAGGLTLALTRATDSLGGQIASAERTTSMGTGAIVFAILAVIALLVARAAFKRRRDMDNARQPIEALRQQVIAGLSYVDGYLDLLPAGADTDLARQQRAQAYDGYSTATGVLKVAKDPAELRRAEPLLRQALSALDRCRAAIDKATGGTGVAMNVPEMPSLQNDVQSGRAYLKTGDFASVEDVRNESERDRLQLDIQSIPLAERGVSFFSGRPLPASELVPVTMVIGGKKRTVMASREEASAISRGETPPVRAFALKSGQYTPWYDYREYDPYRDYYGGWGGPGVGTLVDLYVLTNLLGPATWSGYGPWGYDGYGWGMPLPPVFMNDGAGFYGGGSAGYDGSYGANSGDNGGFFNGGGGDVTPDNAGGTDFLGQQDYSDPGAGFDAGAVDSGGGFDGGGADAGGFDFGGGDAGGGGFDFGGGDSGGGGFDFGGGGDSGGF
jgi:hypothetical protein